MKITDLICWRVIYEYRHLKDGYTSQFWYYHVYAVSEQDAKIALLNDRPSAVITSVVNFGFY